MNKYKQSFFKDKLEKILAKDCIDDMDETMHSTQCQCDKNVKAIIDLVKSIVPDEKELKQYHPQWECDKVHLTYEAKSFNQCRQEILDKLGEEN